MTLGRLGKILQTISSRYDVIRIAATAVLLVNGITLIANSAQGYAGGQPTFTPIAMESRPVDSTKELPKILKRSIPTAISIPAIEVKTAIIQVGKNQDQTLEVPAGDNIDKVGWYKLSPTPGQMGTSVIAGHVNFPDGSPNTFARLGELKAGDTISINREDGNTVEFEITANAIYPKDRFPTEQVYGYSSEPVIKLITCGGVFNSTTQDYDSNIVVSARMKRD